MKNTTRTALKKYAEQIAKLNGVDSAYEKYTVAPNVDQKIIKRLQQSNAFLKKINIIGVTNQKGQKISVGVSGPIASRTNTATKARATRDLSNAGIMNEYFCIQTNFDSHLDYDTLDMWAAEPTFQISIRDSLLIQQSLDMIMVGFNGKSAAADTNIVQNKLGEDINKGWPQHIRENAPQNIMSEGEQGSSKITIGKTGDYKNVDALVMDVTDQFIAEWFQDRTDLVVICGREILSDKFFGIVNNADDNENALAGQVLISSKTIGQLPAVRVPFFPKKSILVTTLSNLSIYLQEGTRRKHMQDNPSRDRVEWYESVNIAYVVNNYDLAGMAENIEFLDD